MLQCLGYFEASCTEDEIAHIVAVTAYVEAVPAHKALAMSYMEASESHIEDM